MQINIHTAQGKSFAWTADRPNIKCLAIQANAIEKDGDVYPGIQRDS
jgi:hypothetical protein